MKQNGEHWGPLTSLTQLIEEILVLDFPDLTRGKPINLPKATLGTLFKGRDQFLGDLHHSLTQSSQGVAAITDKAVIPNTKAKAVAGTGGIGKTRAALEYAWRYEASYSALLFLSAETPEILNTSLAGLSEVLSMPELAMATDEQRIHAVLQWLQVNPGWLMILDNADTPVAANAIKERLSQLVDGQVIITSRIAKWSSSVETIDLGVLDIEDACAYLLEATDAHRQHGEADEASARAVALKTGQLALGLEHAAAWINAQELTFADYLAQWEQDEAGILEPVDEDLMEYPRELVMTWTLSVNQLDNSARELLEELSWLSPEPVPETALSAAPEKDTITLRRAASQLTKYSLANWVQQDENRALQVHRLVQATTRWQQRHISSELPGLERALTWMDAAYQGKAADVRDWPVLEPLAEHVEALCDFAEEEAKTEQAHPTARLLNNVAQLYDHKARLDIAEPLMRRALAIDESSFGVDHPNVAVNLNNLAQLLKATNRLSEAEPLMRRALAIDESSYGEDHPNVAIRLNNLASLLRDTNRLSEAEPLMRRALAIDESSYGKDHPDVAIDLNNLASLLKATNRLSEAEPLMRRALAIDESSFGEDHPNVAIRLNNLALLLQDTNRLSEAEPLMRRAFEIDESSFGEDHPKVAIRLNNLASLLQATNRLSEAEPLMRRALAIFEKSYGVDHPNVVIVRNNLANLV